MPSAVPTILDRIKAEMIAVGLARDPRTGGPNGLPPVYRELPEGAMAPGEGPGTERHDEITVTLYHATDVPPAPFEEWWRTDGVDLWIRVKKPPTARDFEAAFRAAFENKRNWMMGPLNGDNGERIIESRMFTGLRPIDRTPQAYTYVTGYLFSHYIPPELV